MRNTNISDKVEKITEVTKKLIKLVAQLEKLMIGIISLVGWIIILQLIL